MTIRMVILTFGRKIRFRKFLALVGATMIFLGCVIIYRIADYTLYQHDNSEHQFQFQKPLPKRTARPFDIRREFLEEHKELKTQSNNQISKPEKMCKKTTNNMTANLQMEEIYKELRFENVDGGAWKQGWDVETDPGRWNSKKKLKVFVVPHSHNDPGWRKTFKEYYLSETRNILNNMLKKLTEDPKKKFIWAEISFFSLWWDELSQEDQEKVRRLVSEGQLEFVTGGWVMNDEANTHYYSMITQLTEGHQWMKANVNIQPKNGWTIDPFGESPVMAYFLKLMGLQNLVIQRVHYSVKNHFARTRNLEFRWRQTWDEDGSRDLFTHMMPFYSYDIPHTCGPDPRICCQFDFKRLPGNGVSCPWGESPKTITPKNVAVRAQMLLEQYRKKSELYRTDVILVPLGDDFRYQHPAEWENQFENYFKLMSYINTNSELHAQVKFGTLADFFDALMEESSPENFPSLSGDFFTYADRDDHYWSGYYTSRPFYKKMDRTLISYHRSAEILFALGWSAKTLPNTRWLLSPQTGFAKKLRDARRSLGLFQHHDGITGTAKDYVMENYGRKMIVAMSDSQHIIQQVSHLFLSPPNQQYFADSEKVYFEFDNQRKRLNDSPEKKLIILVENETKTLVFFNSLAHSRKELVSIHVFTPYVEIRDPKGDLVVHQICPLFLHDAAMDDTRYELSFIAEVQPLGLASYKIQTKPPNSSHSGALSKVRIFNPLFKAKPAGGFEGLETGAGRKFSIENQFVFLAFRKNGLLQSFTNKKTSDFVPLELDFVRYSARPGTERSGAYLFLPAGNAKVVSVESPLIKVFEGPLFSRVEVKFPNVRHCLTLYNTPDLVGLGLDVLNVVDITGEKNYELAMRLTSHVKSGTEFYTDLNGFQIIRRHRLKKLPIQGNFYPMPSAAFIEDEKTRVTVLTSQPLGVASLWEGELEVLQDRRLQQDDHRGLGQGVTDNKVTDNSFRILVERRLENCQSPPSLLSATAYHSSQSLLYPLVKMIWNLNSQNDLRGSYSAVRDELTFDLHLVSVRTFEEEQPSPSAGFVFHRPRLDTCLLDSASPGDGKVNLNSFLPNHFGDEMRVSSLSFLNEEEKSSKRKTLQLCYMDLFAVLLS